ncbi:MAG: LapA family protein [Candidatus Omnitrophica bacterium]|nr:LapA family protein [Candidatus Omnitrophota bacterium]
MKLKRIILLVLGCLLLIILLQNTQVVTLRFLFWKLSMSRIILLPLVIVIGFSLGFFIGRRSSNRKT